MMEQERRLYYYRRRKTGCSIVFARLRQRALPSGYIGATRRIRLKLFRSCRVHNPNGKSTGSAVSAQLTSESLYALQRALLSQKWGIWTPI